MQLTKIKKKREPRKIVRSSHHSPIRRVRSQGLFADQDLESIKKNSNKPLNLVIKAISGLL